MRKAMCGFALTAALALFVGVAPALATTELKFSHCGSGSQTVQANQVLVISGVDCWLAGPRR
jgi:hypothetical protein